MAKTDVCEQITQAIIAELERGVMPWVKSWQDAGRVMMPRRHGGERYRGINVLILWAEGLKKGYRSPVWLTFKQARSYKAHVQKGEHGTQIIYVDRIVRQHETESGETAERVIPFLKTYTVFNSEQVEGLPERFAPPPAPVLLDHGAIPGLDYFECIPADVRHGEAGPHYVPSLDYIALPQPGAFKDPVSYLTTRAHETVHWTAHEKRLGRSFASRKWGDEGYAMEELVGELGAAFCMASIGIVPAIREDHAPYIAGWLKVLKRDSRALLTAASKASDALDYLDQFQPDAEAEKAEAEAA